MGVPHFTPDTPKSQGGVHTEYDTGDDDRKVESQPGSPVSPLMLFSILQLLYWETLIGKASDLCFCKKKKKTRRVVDGHKFKGHGSSYVQPYLIPYLICFVILPFFQLVKNESPFKAIVLSIRNWPFKGGHFDADNFFSLLITGKNRVRRRRVAKDPRVRSIGLCDEDQRAAAQYAVWMDGATGESHFLIFLNLPFAHFEAATLLLTRVSTDKLKAN